MKYARTAGLKPDRPWHMLFNGTALCYPSFALDLGDILEERPEDVCGNCDARLRERGREKKPASEPKIPVAQDDYRPKYREKFE